MDIEVVGVEGMGRPEGKSDREDALVDIDVESSEIDGGGVERAELIAFAAKYELLLPIPLGESDGRVEEVSSRFDELLFTPLPKIPPKNDFPLIERLDFLFGVPTLPLSLFGVVVEE